jgi:hAT family C-terminal dimerisation region
VPRISIAEALQRHTPQSTQQLQIAQGDQQAILQSKFREALVAYICCAHIAFSVVESEWFLALLTTLSDLTAVLVPTSHNTTRDWVVKSYERRKQKVKNLLHQARSKIHLSFDLWTSPNHYAFNAVVAHFVTPGYKVVSVLLAFRNLLGPHSGENIAGTVQNVCREYDIESQLGCFILDNASNNDTCIATLGKAYGWNLNEQRQRRLRCLGHIINLVAQAFILGEKKEAFDRALKACEDDREEEVKLWQLCGPIGKLHYIVVFILKTPQRRQTFQAGNDDYDPTELVPKRDNSTRWNSVYRMIKRALQLRQQIDIFCYYSCKGDFTDDIRLNVDDWYILTQLADAMQCFEDATLMLEGHAQFAEFGQMGECIPIIEALSTQLTKLQNEYPLPSTFPITNLDNLPEVDPDDKPGSNPATGFITECTNRAFTKLADYYGKTDNSIWFTAGLIMNPTVKWKYFKHQWKDEPSWIDDVQARILKLWLQYRSNTPTKSNKRTLSNRGPQPAKSVRREGNYRDSAIYSWRNISGSSDDEPHLDEYEQYLAEKVEDPSDNPDAIMRYWEVNSKRWPNLSRLAFDALSIPAMSAECERVFSSGKNMIKTDRYSLNPDSIEAGECNRHWLIHKTA